MAKFPTIEWIHELDDKLNNDEQYARIARKWEGDVCFRVDPGGDLKESISFYLDLWHGTCRRVELIEGECELDPALSIIVPYDYGKRILERKMDVMQALLTRKLRVKGSMTLLVRNVPTVLDFVRCCREVTDSFI